MKIYNQNPLDLNLGSLQGIGKIILALLLIIGLFWILSGAASPVLQAQLLQNPLHLSANESTILNVQLTNPNSTSVFNVIENITTPGSSQLSVYPVKQTIPMLGPQETRKLEFVVLPVDTKTNPFLPGTYRVDVSTALNEQPYQISVFVQVEK